MTTLGEFARGGLNVDSREGLRQLNRYGGGLAGSKSKAVMWAHMQQQQQAAHDAAVKKIRAMQGAMETDVSKVERMAAAARDQAFSVQDMANQVDHPSAFAMSQDAQDAAHDIGSIADEARRAYDEFENEFNAKRSAGGQYGAPLLAKANSTAETIKMLGGRINRASGALSATIGRLQSLQKEAAAQAAAEAERQAAAQAAAQAASDAAAAAAAAAAEQSAAAQAAQLAQEQAQREMEYQLQQQQLEDQRQLREEERSLEAAERARLAQIEQARIDAEMRREYMAVEAEERRRRLEDEARIREEERQLRTEEREAQLQQLMLIQELAAAGLPVQQLPAGLPQPQQPQQPQQQFYMPGFAQPGIPQQAWSPYGPMVPGPGGPAPTGFAPEVPGAALVPFQQAAPPGYAATSPQQIHHQAAAQAQSAPPGFAWTGFDPGAEMFGMGDIGGLAPTINPNLQGALIEEGWSIHGPEDDGMYTVVRPNGQTLDRYSEDQLFMGGIRDPQSHLLVKGLGANALIFVPPSERPESGAASAGREIAATIREAIKGATSVMSERERRKAAKYSAATPAAAMPTYAAIPTPTRMPTMVWVVAGVGAAAAAFWGISKLAKKG